VNGPVCDGFENQKIKRALNEIRLLARHM